MPRHTKAHRFRGGLLASLRYFLSSLSFLHLVVLLQSRSNSVIRYLDAVWFAHLIY